MNTATLRTISIFEFILNLTSALRSLPQVKSIFYFYESGHLEELPQYDDIEHICRTDLKIELTLLIANNNDYIYKIPYTLSWHDYILSDAFSNKPPNPDTDIYDFITSYAFPVYDSSLDKNIILLDSASHHPELTTHPHHLHFYTNYGTKKDAQNFSGQLYDLIDCVAKNCKLY